MAKNKWKRELNEAAQPVNVEYSPTGEKLAVEEVVLEQAPKFDFDAWYAMRGNKIPRQHHKEILKADFKARGLQQCESIEDFDAALEKYGVKLD